MRIVSLYYMHKPGGLCQRLYRLLTALAERGHEVIFFALEKPPQLSEKVTFQKISFPFFLEKSGLLFWWTFILWCPIFMCFRLRELKPDRLVCFHPLYVLMLQPARRLVHHCPLILFVRAIGSKNAKLLKKFRFEQTFLQLVEKIAATRAQKIVCLTEVMKAEITNDNVNVAPIALIPNDIPNLTISNKMTPRKFTILSAGVLDKRKNIGLLIRAFELLITNGADLPEIIIAGDGPLLNKFRELGLDGVDFVGWCEDIAPLLARSSLYVHPALHEGMSNSILEALSLGVPVIASDIPEVREMLKFDELLFDPKDPIALALRISELMRDNAAYARVKKLSEERASYFRFDWNEQASTLVTDPHIEAMNQLSPKTE